MKKVINKKILPWLLFSCLSYLPIAAACSSNQATKVVNQQSDNDKSDNTNQPNAMNGLFGMGDDAQKGEQPSTNELDNIKSGTNPQDQSLNTNQEQARDPGVQDSLKQTPEMNQAQAEQTQSLTMGQAGELNDDQAVVDQEDGAVLPSPQATIFPDLNLNKEVSVVNSKYQNLHANVAWDQLKDHLEDVLSLFKTINHIDDKYQVTIQANVMTFPDQVKGEIRDLIARIKLNNQYQDFDFSLVGFKKQVISPQLQKEHAQYLTKKTHIDEQLTALYPSFLASMLYYADNIPKKPHIESTQLKLDYYSFLNNNDELLNFHGLSINNSLLSQFFNYQNPGEYVTKVVGIKFDDLNGLLGLRIRVSRADANNYENPEFEEEFEFSGFRKINFNQLDQNVLSFSLLTTSLKKILHSSNVLQYYLKKYQDQPVGFDILQHLPQNDMNHSFLNILKRKIYNELGGVITDNLHGIYHSTLGENLSLHALGAINGSYGIYPFFTNYHLGDLFHNLSLKITGTNSSELKNITLRFDVKLPLFVVDHYTANEINHSSVDQHLLLPVSSTIPLVSAIKNTKA